MRILNRRRPVAAVPTPASALRPVAAIPTLAAALRSAAAGLNRYVAAGNA